MSSHDQVPDGTRKIVADHLYLDRGPGEASARCDANAQFGTVDLCDEMLRHLDLQAGDSVVDVGCGSGQHLLRFAEIVGDTGRAQGFDFSPGAVEKTRARGLQAEAADGANLPVEDQTFNKLSSSFAIYYLPDASLTVREWFRVLRSGGRAAISGPATGTNKELYDFHEALTGEGPADTDVMALGYVAALDQPMADAGFKDIEIIEFDNPINFPTAEHFITYWSNTSLFARSVSDDKREEVLAAGRERLASAGDRHVVTKRITIAKGVRA